MKEKFVPSVWLEKEGRRLDCGPYLSGAIEAKILLEKLPVKKLPLCSLTKGHDGGIYNGPQFVRNYVDDPRYGVRFLTSSSMLVADLAAVDLLRKRDAMSSRLRFLELHEGMTLISCSGTIGNMVYARPEMNGVWSSQDILKVVPDTDQIPAGYLYAFLSSHLGVPLVIGDEYGSVQRHIEPQHISKIPIPRLSSSIEARAHALITEAGKLRLEASQSLEAARDLLRIELGVPPVDGGVARLGHPTPSTALAASSRFEAFFHNPQARLLDDWIASYRGGHTELGEAARVFDVPQFKHIYVEPGVGTAFFTSGDLFLLDRRPEKYLSRKVTKDLEKYILQPGWVLLARSGQVGGIIGRPQFVDSGMDGAAASDHVIRIVAQTGWTAGFLYSYLSLSEVGYHLLVRTATGASIPALWPSYLNRIRVPIVSDGLQTRLDKIITAAFEKRVNATKKEDAARTLVEETIVTLGEG